MASALNLCQHFDSDGTSCTSFDYTLCPHCQLQLCLRHLNAHQEYLRSDCDRLSDHINCLRDSLDHLEFDPNNQRDDFLQQIDQWYQQRLEQLHEIYRMKKEQFHLFYAQARSEFENCKAEKERQFQFSLARQWLKVSRQKQIHIDDLTEMKYKLTSIERGLDELNQCLIDVSVDPLTMDIDIVKRRYVEAAKTSFHDDDDHVIWSNDDDEEKTESDESKTSVFSPVDTEVSQDPIKTTKSTDVSIPATNQNRRGPLKFIIKRLKDSPKSTKHKYKFQTVSSAELCES